MCVFFFDDVIIILKCRIVRHENSKDILNLLNSKVGDFFRMEPSALVKYS